MNLHCHRDIIVLTALVLLRRTPLADGPARPNILFALADDWGFCIVPVLAFVLA